MKKSLNIAHRGFSGKYPENTMLAFRKAVEAGCDGIENDVQMTKDGVLVICHDEAVDRTTDGSGFIPSFTYEEIRKLDAGIKFGKEYKEEKIPSLDEFFQYVKDKNLYINLELKNGIIQYEGMEEKVIKKIYDYSLKDNIILSSFNHYSMVKCKEIDSSIKTGLLYEAGLYKPEKYIKYVGADALHPHFFSVLFDEVVKPIKESGVIVNTYTVNEEKHMERLIELGIEGIITNYPDRLAKLINKL